MKYISLPFATLRRTLPAIAIGWLAFAGRPADDTDTYRINTIRQVMKRITAEHFQPPVLDDAFSASVWKKYIESQDINKGVFLREDIDRLKAWERQLDDEMREPTLAFFKAYSETLTRRIREIMPLYRGILSKPMDFTRNEYLDESKKEYAATAAGREAIWQKRMKLTVLKKIAELRKADPKLTFAAAEKEARRKVLVWLDASYNNLIGITSDDDRFSMLLNTVLMEIDPHTNFYAPADSRDRDAQMAQRYFGVGLELLTEEGEIRIGKILPGGSADRSGLLRLNDHVVGVTDLKGAMVRVSGLSALDVTRMVRGDSGTVLRMLVSRAGVEKEVSLTRGEIKDNTTAAKCAVIEQDGKKIGYIQLPSFYRDFSRMDGAACSADVAKAIVKLKEASITGLIIDLRGNLGGSLEEVQKMAGLFLPEGPVAQGRFKAEKKRFDMVTYQQMLYDGPLTVMIDESSASASEMFSAAMQDYGRAVIVGSATSFGKGTMQETRLMGKMGSKTLGTPNIRYGSIALTLGRFYRITGVPTQLIGVTPDVVFPTKGEYSALREKSYATALRPDSMEAAYYMKSKHAGAVAAAIAGGRARAEQDTGFAGVRQSVAWLKAHAADAKPLGYKAYQQSADVLAEQEQRLEAGGQLPPAARLQLRQPDASPLEDYEAARYQEWLRVRTTDRYIYHAIGILRDLAK